MSKIKKLILKKQSNLFHQSLFDKLNADVPTARQAANKPPIVMSNNGKIETQDIFELEIKKAKRLRFALKQR